ncbi:hypothetical protein MACH23_14740 [Sulfitobacter pontiacus]|nr:hypothetical protein MACH23_14740 [Sulfitobacter pontiacus]
MSIWISGSAGFCPDSKRLAPNITDNADSPTLNSITSDPKFDPGVSHNPDAASTKAAPNNRWTLRTTAREPSTIPACAEN